MSEQYGDATAQEEETPETEEKVAEAPEDLPVEEDSEPTPESSLAAERDDYLASLQRLQADFDNYRKRSVRQQTELLGRATEGLLVQLLPVLDALDLAEAHASEAEKAALNQVGSLLRSTLERQGLERIDSVGVDFDPTEHDAVAHEEPDDDTGEGRHEVSEVMRAGYRLKGRVVRPAMVKVKG